MASYFTSPPGSMSSASGRTNGLEKEIQDRNGSDATLADETQKERKQMSSLHEIFFILTICLAQIFALAGVGQGLASMYPIGETFGVTDLAELSWYIASFSLTVGTFILPSGRLGDIYGHKKLFVIGTIWYGLWSLVCGFSVYSGNILFSVSRGFQGVGPALIVPNALAIAGRSFEGKKKNYVFALFGASAPAGATLGALFAAIFSQLVWWPWTYWSMGIILLAYTATSFLILPPDELDSTMQGVSKPSFDYLGTATGVTGLILFNFAWNQAGVVGWNVPYNYILLIIGITFFAAFIYVETHIAKHPLVPISMLSKEACFALSIIACGWASFGIWVFYIWQLILRLRHYSLLSAAAQQSPVVLSGLLASLTVGYLLQKTSVSNIMILAMCCFLTGQILLATAPVGQTYWIQTFLSLIIMPWGMDMSFPAGTIILSNGMPREHQGMAASLINTVVNYSISLSLGVAGTIIRSLEEGREEIEVFRAAWYFSIGLDGLGLAVAVYYAWSTWSRGRKVSGGEK